MLEKLSENNGYRYILEDGDTRHVSTQEKIDDLAKLSEIIIRAKNDATEAQYYLTHNMPMPPHLQNNAIAEYLAKNNTYQQEDALPKIKELIDDIREYVISQANTNHCADMCAMAREYLNDFDTFRDDLAMQNHLIYTLNSWQQRDFAEAEEQRRQEKSSSPVTQR